VTTESDELESRLLALVKRYGLGIEAATKLRLLLERLLEDPLAPTSIRGPEEIVDHHLADALVALELEEVRAARLALDLGSGPGIPGLPLAAALPEATFVLLESAGRKCAFLERTANACGIRNVEVVHRRAESHVDGHGRHDLVTARAVARLDVTAEYAAPLLRVGGTLVVWGGRRSREAELAAEEAAREIGLAGLEVRRVEPFPQAHNRYLHLMSKVRETPSRFPRRPGVASKRPLGRRALAPGSSDRAER
jgi:16S rRNA (guanine527-N7)-methyltransferase